MHDIWWGWICEQKLSSTVYTTKCDTSIAVWGFYSHLLICTWSWKIHSVFVGPEKTCYIQGDDSVDYEYSLSEGDVEMSKWYGIVIKSISSLNKTSAPTEMFHGQPVRNCKSYIHIKEPDFYMHKRIKQTRNNSSIKLSVVLNIHIAAWISEYIVHIH